MSSWRAVLRILALLQRKTLIETKNRTLKCLNGTIQLCKLTEDRAFALFFIPSSGDLTAQEPHPREFAIQGKTNGNALGSAWRGERGDWAQLELTDA